LSISYVHFFTNSVLLNTFVFALLIYCVLY